MGDVRFQRYLERIRDADNAVSEIRALTDEGVISALAAAVSQDDRYLANVLATEAHNRVRRSRAVLQNLAEGVLAYDAEYRVTFLNPAAQALLGWREVQGVGRCVFEVLGVEDREPWPLKEVLETGETEREEDGTFRHSDGHALPVAYTCAPLLREGQIVGAVVAFRDVTEHRRAEALMRQQAASMEASMDGMAILDAAGRFIYVNEAHASVYGFADAADMIGETWHILYDPDEARRFEREILPRVAREGRWRGEAVGRRQDGTLFPQEVSLSSIAGDGLVCMVRDATERKRAEASLRESERRFRAVFNQAYAFLGVLTPDGTLLDVNDAVLKVSGFTRDQVVGVKFWDTPWWRGLPEEGAKLRADVEAALRGEPARGMTTYLTSDGTTRSADREFTPVKDATGAVTLVVVAGLDVTGRQATEEALRASEERYRSLFERNPDAVYVLDRDGRVLEANPACARILGRPLSDILGSHWEPFVLPEDAPQALDSFRASLRGESARFRLRVARGDGKVATLAGASFPLYQDGAVLGVWGIAEDVTDRLQAESALRARETLYRTLVQTSPNAIVVTDLETRVIMANARAAELHGVESPDAIVGRASHEFLPEFEWEHASRDARRLLEGGALRDEEYTLIRADGTRYRGEVNATVVRDERGAPTAFLAVIRDVTERRRAEAALRESEERFRRLAEAAFEGVLVHDAGRILDVSEALARMFGYTRAELIGKDARILGPPGAQKKVRAAFATGRESPYETEGCRKDGARFPIEIRGRDAPLDGRKVRVAVIRDLTDRVRAEGARRESEERFRELAETVDAVFWLVEADSARVLYVNPAYDRVWGRPRSELLEHPDAWLDAVHPEDRERVRRAHDAMVREGRPYDIEYRIECPDGTFRWIHDRRRSVAAEEGRPARLAGIAEDVTEAKAAETALRDAEEKWRSLTANSPDHILVLDREGRIQFINRTVPGLAMDDVLGHEVAEFISPEDRGRVQAVLDCALRTGIAQRYESTGPGANGTVRLYHTSIAPIGRAPDVRGLILLSEDVTEEREARARLASSEARWRSLVTTSPEFITTIRPDGKIVFLNRAPPDGTPASILGTSVYTHVHDEDRSRIAQAIAAAAETGESQIAEARAKTPGGEWRWYRSSFAPLPSEDGEGRILVVSVDITAHREADLEIRRLNEALARRVETRTRALEAANRELEAFSYSVSHDLRAPLRGIEYFVQALDEEYGERLDNQGREYLARLRGESRRLSELIADILQLSRAGRGELRRVRVDVTALAQEIISGLMTSEPQRRVSITVEPDLVAEADATLLRAVLENLIGNAWKFTRTTSQPLIHVGDARISGERVFFVRDNGVGFDIAKAGRLFMPFQRLHAGSEFEGTGVGLATVKRAIDRHGGRVWAESRPGEGATFYFTLGES